MKLRRSLLLALAAALIVLIGVLYLKTRPAPILTVMTWPGAYGRAQASAQMRPFGVEKNVDVRTALWDGDLKEIRAMVEKRDFKADVIDFELPAAVRACQEKLLEKIDSAILPAGADQDVSDWGGAYDKTSVDKLARVVVTVDYGIDR